MYQVRGKGNRVIEIVTVIVSMSKVYMKDSDQKLQALVHKMAKAKLNITKSFIMDRI